MQCLWTNMLVVSWMVSVKIAAQTVFHLTLAGITLAVPAIVKNRACTENPTKRHPSRPFIAVFIFHVRGGKTTTDKIRNDRNEFAGHGKILCKTTDRGRTTTDKTLNCKQHSYLPKRVGYARRRAVGQEARDKITRPPPLGDRNSGTETVDVVISSEYVVITRYCVCNGPIS